MRIVLVNTPNYDPFFIRRNQPLGLAYIAAQLETNGYDVEIIDGDLYRPSKRDLVEQIKTLVPAHRNCVVGFSTITMSFSHTMRIITELRKSVPSVFIVLGGHHASALHHDILTKCHEVDAVVRGEGEHTMVEVVQKLEDGKQFDKVKGLSYRCNKGVGVNPPRPLIRDLDSLPFPARQKLLPLSTYSELSGLDKVTGSLMSSRGCPFQCVFCDIHSFYERCIGPVWRSRSPSKVADEIEELVDMGAEHVSFLDDSFLLNRNSARKICSEIRKRGVRIMFDFETRSDLVVKNENILKTLRKTGFNAVLLGVESGSQNALNRYSKGTTVKCNADAIRLLREAGFLVEAGFVMFDPETTLEDLMQNIEFLKDNDLFFQRISLLLNHLIPYPNTRFYSKMVTEKRISRDIYSLDSIFIKPKQYFRNRRVALVYSTFYEWLTHEGRQVLENLLTAEAKLVTLRRMARRKEPAISRKIGVLIIGYHAAHFALQKLLLALLKETVSVADSDSVNRNVFQNLFRSAKKEILGESFRLIELDRQCEQVTKECDA